MKIATWNVNSLKIRLPHVIDWLAENPVDALCLQETKTIDEKFPVDALREAGYHAAFQGQKTYNGVAILAPLAQPLGDVVFGIPGFEDDQRRVISATVNQVRLVCAYFPNGQAVGSDKYAYKLRWLEALIAWLAVEIGQHAATALLGDYNIAPEDRDVHDPAAWVGQVLVSEAERKAFEALVALGFRDTFRMFEQPDKLYSWWDYRMLAFRRNMGLRIDHILVSPSLVPRVTACVIDRAARKREQPSDHAPVVATLS
jgi:exodeoxyribonuclease-3